MKKYLLLSSLALIVALATKAQPISIVAADMPVSGDSLRYSVVNPFSGTIDIITTGPSTTWNYSSLVPVSQGLDQYKTALQVNASYALTISPTAYGYKVADSIPGAPIPVTDVYTFFSKKSNPSRFVAEAFAAKVAGLPTPINYSDEDEWYFFPLTYNDIDTSTFKLKYTAPGGLGWFSQQGNRKTIVDGWGTITTPHFTNPISVIRVVSEVTEVDSFSFSGNTSGIPRHFKEYKWLANGEHYPVLWITTSIVGTAENITSVRFRDHYRYYLGVEDVAASVQELNAYPNPASGDIVTVTIPKDFQYYSTEVFDVQGKLVSASQNTPDINVASLSKGQYIVRVLSGEKIGYVRIIR